MKKAKTRVYKPILFSLIAISITLPLGLALIIDVLSGKPYKGWLDLGLCTGFFILAVGNFICFLLYGFGWLVTHKIRMGIIAITLLIPVNVLLFFTYITFEEGWRVSITDNAIHVTNPFKGVAKTWRFLPSSLPENKPAETQKPAPPEGADCEQFFGEACSCGEIHMVNMVDKPLSFYPYELHTPDEIIKGCANAEGVIPAVKVKVTGSCQVRMSKDPLIEAQCEKMRQNTFSKKE